MSTVFAHRHRASFPDPGAAYARARCDVAGIAFRRDSLEGRGCDDQLKQPDISDKGGCTVANSSHYSPKMMFAAVV